MVDEPVYRAVRRIVTDKWRAERALGEGWEGVPLLRGQGFDEGVLRRTGQTCPPDDEDMKVAKQQWWSPHREDCQESLMGTRRQEGARLAAVYSAREQRSRAMEGCGDGWRAGRGCSVAEWEHKERDKRERWQPVVRRNGRRKGPRGLAIGATVQVETTGAGREEDQRWETRTVLGHTYTPEGFKHHLLEAGRGTKETDLRKTRWRTGEGGELGSSARQMGWGGQPRGAGESRTGVAPMRLRQLWTGEREEGRTDATLRRAKEGMVAGLAALQRAAGRAQGGGTVCESAGGSV